MTNSFIAFVQSDSGLSLSELKYVNLITKYSMIEKKMKEFNFQAVKFHKMRRNLHHQNITQPYIKLDVHEFKLNNKHNVIKGIFINYL